MSCSGVLIRTQMPQPRSRKARWPPHQWVLGRRRCLLCLGCLGDLVELIFALDVLDVVVKLRVAQ
jgi:hypothetical protein